MTITMNIAEQGQTSSIAVDALKLHPKNARKEYDRDGITELADSIRAKGVLQNLTVVPDKDEEGTFLVVIGNRRLLAAREAGIETVPCVVREMDEAEQATAMLTENMQRKGLTATEEAGAMQMCFADFGMDVERLSSETGLSQTTVRHRLNVAKLDQGILKEKEADEGFQLSLTDLAALEKIKSVKKRNEILKNASSSRDLAGRALSIANDEKRKKNEKGFTALAGREGIRPATDQMKNETYSGKWETLAKYSLDGKAPKEFAVNDGDGNAVPHGEMYYIIRWRDFEIIRKAKRVKKELTESEKKAREVRKARRQHKAAYREMLAEMGDFYRGIAGGKIKDIRKKDMPGLIQRLWGVMMQKATDVSCYQVALALAEGDYWKHTAEERKELTELAERLPVHVQMLGVAYQGMKGVELMDSDGHYFKFAADIFRTVYELFGRYGFSFKEKEQLAVIDGTHGLYIARESADPLDAGDVRVMESGTDSETEDAAAAQDAETGEEETGHAELPDAKADDDPDGEEKEACTASIVLTDILEELKEGAA